jgi:hypothetical protein
MSKRLVSAHFGLAIAISVGCSTAAAADGQQAGSVYTMSSGRLVAGVAAMTGLIGVVLGGLALRSTGRVGTGSGRLSASVALVLGLIGVALGGLVVTTAGGGVGTGNGFGGGVVALVTGLIGIALSGLAMAHRRRGAGHFSPIPSSPPSEE